MHLWWFKKTKQDHSGAEKFAYVDKRQLLLFQNYASPFAAPIVKNLAYMKNLNVLQGGMINVFPTVGLSGYGGVVSGQIVLQPLQNMNASSGGL